MQLEFMWSQTNSRHVFLFTVFDKLGMTRRDSSHDHKRNSNSIDNNTSVIIARAFYNSVKQEYSQVMLIKTSKKKSYLVPTQKRGEKNVCGLTLGTKNIYLV